MKQITLLFLILLASTALSASLAACASAPPPATVPHETLDTATAAPHPTEAPTPTATATATLTPEITVTEGSEWAKAGVPAGLTVKEVNNVFYAINLVGQKIKIGNKTADGSIEPASWLQYQPAQEQVENGKNLIPYDPEIALNIFMLRAVPFDTEKVQICQPGDVAASSKNPLSGTEMGYSYLHWTDKSKNKEDRSAKIIGYLKTVYENGQQMWVKGVEWLTPDGITYTINLTSTQFYTASAGDEREVFPTGLVTRPPTDNEIQPNSILMRNPETNKLLEEWILTGCPPPELQSRFVYGYPGIKPK